MTAHKNCKLLKTTTAFTYFLFIMYPAVKSNFINIYPCFTFAVKVASDWRSRSQNKVQSLTSKGTKLLKEV